MSYEQFIYIQTQNIMRIFLDILDGFSGLSCIPKRFDCSVIYMIISSVKTKLKNWIGSWSSSTKILILWIRHTFQLQLRIDSISKFFFHHFLHCAFGLFDLPVDIKGILSLLNSLFFWYVYIVEHVRIAVLQKLARCQRQ